ncbi:MAG: hypothetical protein ACTHOM_01885 [Allomuricauda sp.]
MKQILLRRYFGFQGCFEDCFLVTPKLHQHLVFFGNPQQRVLIPTDKNHFYDKTKDPLQLERVFLLNNM